MTPIKTARQYRDFVHLAESLGDLERVVIGTKHHFVATLLETGGERQYHQS